MKNIETRNKLNISDRCKSSFTVILLVLFLIVSFDTGAQNNILKTVGLDDLCRSHLFPVNLNKVLQISLAPGIGKWYYNNEGSNEEISNIFDFRNYPLKDTYEFTYEVSNYKSTCIDGVDKKFKVTVKVKDLDIPSGNIEQLFCYQPDQIPTINDLQATGNNVKWYAAEESNRPLANDYQLSNNTTYYATQSLAGCGESTKRFPVTVGMSVIPSIAVEDSVERFQAYNLNELKIDDAHSVDGLISFYDAFPDTVNDIRYLLTDLQLKENKNIFVMKSTPEGCYDVDSVSVLVTKGIEVPKGFSPNNDNTNDRFVIKGLELFPDNELIVANRQGSIVYRMKNYKNDWDGIPNTGLLIGHGILPEGTYFLVLKIHQTGSVIKDYVYIKH